MYIGIGGIEKSVFGIPNTGFGHLKLLHTGRKHVGVISSANIWIIHKFRVEGAFNGKNPEYRIVRTLKNDLGYLAIFLIE